MGVMLGHVVAIGGGGFLGGDTASPLNDLFLVLAGVERPHVVFLPTATGDSVRALDLFEAAWSRRPCTTDVALTFGVPDRPAERVAAADILVVAGGNTANMLAVWRLHGVDDGLGFLAGSFCPHFDGEERRRPVYTRLVSEGFPAGLACDDGAAAVFRGTELLEIVADRPGASGYRVAADRIEPLPARRLR
jgi:dipeptidase E